MNWAGSFMCLSFKRELFEGIHNFALDTFRLSLYGDNAALNEYTTSYVGVGELPTLDGYTTGGAIITIDPPLLVDRTALVPFETVVWSPASFKARGALCYNDTKPGQPAVFVLDFGVLREANGNMFAVQFPGPDPNAAIVRMK
jgi:hypothetical protein